MNKLARIMMMYGIAMSINDANNKIYNHRHIGKPVSGEKRGRTKGLKYTYPDGFECWALNQKNADRKHENWKRNEN